MSNTSICPYCEYENDMTDALCDLGNDNTFDWECQSCGKDFEVEVEFEPSYLTGKIEYEHCDVCGKYVRNVYREGRVFPFPKKYKGKKLCHECFYKALGEEMK